MYLDLKPKTARVISDTVIINSLLTVSNIKTPLKVLDPKLHKLNSNKIVLVEREKRILAKRSSPKKLLNKSSENKK